nr:MAG TPA: Protein of unknown function (DUF1595) [Caudoviricetes sp.]
MIIASPTFLYNVYDVGSLYTAPSFRTDIYKASCS